MQRRADALSKAAAPTKDVLPHLLAAGQVGPAVELLMRQKQYEQAAHIAAVAACGWVLQPPAKRSGRALQVQHRLRTGVQSECQHVQHACGAAGASMGSKALPKCMRHC